MIEGLIALGVMAVAAATVLGFVRISRWAREHPNLSHHDSDTASGISEDEWSQAIR